MADQNKQKNLSEVFRELERNKNKQVQIYKNTQKQKMESSFIFHVKQRTKKDNIILVLIVLILLFMFSLFSRNYIFAVTVDNGPKNAIGTFESNDAPKDVYAILSKNISNTQQKEIFDQEETIEYEIEYVSNKDMPEGETVTLQEGIEGNKIVTYVTSFENDVVIEQICKQLNRLINTIKVVELPKSADKCIDRELILCKVSAKDDARSEILRIAEIFGAKIIDVTPDIYTLEYSGDNRQVMALISLLRPIGIKEIVRSGMVAITRENQFINLHK